MATTNDFMNYVLRQVNAAGVVEHKKMFGEYALYLDGKCVALVCDDSVYVKMLPEIATMMDAAETGLPYPSAKPHYILDVAHRQHAIAVLKTLAAVLPFPKPRKPRRASSSQ